MNSQPHTPLEPIIIIEEETPAGGPGMAEMFAQLRACQQELARAQQDGQRMSLAGRMHEVSAALTSTARLAGLSAAARCGESLGLLLRDIIERPRNLGPETLRTIAQAVDLLHALIQAGAQANDCDPGPGSVLIVDDEPISRRAVSSALEKVGLKSTAVEQPAVALSLLRENAFDLVTLDVGMPDMSGHDLCATLRDLPRHRFTPVMVVTGLDNLENRAASLACGACDVATKPFRHAEFGLRALLRVMRSRFEAGRG